MVITIVVLLLSIFVKRRWKFRFIPSPGVCLPLIGHVYKFDSKTAEDPVGGLWRLYRKYQKDGMLHMNTFGLNVVFIGDFETLKYVYNHPNVQDRLTGLGLEEPVREEKRVKGKLIPGVISSEGKAWQEQRRFSLKTLRDFGFGKQGMEELIQEEVDLFKGLIDKKNGEPFDFINQFNVPILNALWRITSGERFDYDHPKLESIVERLTENFKRAGNPANIVVYLYPWITKIYPKFMERNRHLGVIHEILDLLEDSIKRHKENLDIDSPNDYTDAMLIEMTKTKDPSSSFYGIDGMENLTNNLMDFFMAGSETTSTTLTWAMLYMVRYPQVQKKVQEELDRVVGRNRSPTLQDRSSLPYTEAVIMEVQRCGNIIPTGVQHVNSKDIVVNGYTIPAFTLIQPLLTEILKGDHWQNGTTFCPERFVDDNGKVKKDEHFIPFSIGKRVCLGETLAKVELFLFFSNIVHNYNLAPEIDGEMPSEDYTPGLTILPKPFKVKLLTRG